MPPHAFMSLNQIKAALADLPVPDPDTIDAVGARDSVLTKPPGSLGRLETIAAWYCGWRDNPKARVERPQVAIFAGNHGVVAQGISAFPAEVTSQMVANFEAGGAAINQLAANAGARLDVHPIQLEHPTADFTQSEAMTEGELLDAFAIGVNAVDTEADLFVAGEMGIGNTTSAAAIAAALFGGSGREWVGRGTGIDDAGLARKSDAVDAGLARHRGCLEDPFGVLQCLGGREIAAMTGAIFQARQLRIPVIIDGFICTAAAAVLAQTAHGALDHCLAGHCSDEAGHARLLNNLGLEPLVNLGLRLGEGSGAALTIPLVAAATACHAGMATFAEAGVSES